MGSTVSAAKLAAQWGGRARRTMSRGGTLRTASSERVVGGFC